MSLTDRQRQIVDRAALQIWPDELEYGLDSLAEFVAMRQSELRKLRTAEVFASAKRHGRTEVLHCRICGNRSEGSEMDNPRTLCFGCNATKADRMPV